jgi:hypothetical protein
MGVLDGLWMGVNGGWAHWPMSLRWWAVLCGIAVANLAAWLVGAAWLRRKVGTVEPALYRVRRRHLFLSGAFVAVCAFRSVFPRADVQRICLLDSWLSSVAVGRTLATVAELCFVAQWALLLRELGEKTGATLTVRLSKVLVPLIVVAECCSWYAVLTTRYLGNVLEESLWTVTASLAIVGAAATWSRLAPRHRPWLAAGLVAGLGYVTFMCTVDVPMYLARWLRDESAHRTYLSLREGLADVASRWVVTHSWQQWRTEVPWMSLYFSVAVWMSIAFTHLPRVEKAGAGKGEGRTRLGRGGALRAMRG